MMIQATSSHFQEWYPRPTLFRLTATECPDQLRKYMKQELLGALRGEYAIPEGKENDFLLQRYCWRGTSPSSVCSVWTSLRHESV